MNESEQNRMGPNRIWLAVLFIHWASGILNGALAAVCLLFMFIAYDETSGYLGYGQSNGPGWHSQFVMLMVFAAACFGAALGFLAGNVMWALSSLWPRAARPRFTATLLVSLFCGLYLIFFMLEFETGDIGSSEVVSALAAVGIVSLVIALFGVAHAVTVRFMARWVEFRMNSLGRLLS